MPDPNFLPETFQDILDQLEAGVLLRYVPTELLEEELPPDWDGQTCHEAVLVLGRHQVDAGLSGDVTNALQAGSLVEEQDPDLQSVFHVRLA